MIANADLSFPARGEGWDAVHQAAARAPSDYRVRGIRDRE